MWSIWYVYCQILYKFNIPSFFPSFPSSTPALSHVLYWLSPPFSSLSSPLYPPLLPSKYTLSTPNPSRIHSSTRTLPPLYLLKKMASIRKRQIRARMTSDTTYECWDGAPSSPEPERIPCNRISSHSNGLTWWICNSLSSITLVVLHFNFLPPRTGHSFERSYICPL